MELTRGQIRQDIEAYQDRLSKVEAKLNDLPQKGHTWKENNKIRETRRALLSEIRHVKTLIGYAQQALAETVG